jgi:hypothetical protein
MGPAAPRTDGLRSGFGIGQVVNGQKDDEDALSNVDSTSYTNVQHLDLDNWQTAGGG